MLAITAGIVAYLQGANPELLKFTSSRRSQAEAVGGWRSTRGLWAGVAVLMLVTPLGLIAAGTAWGEWSADYSYVLIDRLDHG